MTVCLLLIAGPWLAAAQFTEINAGFTAVSSGRALWGDYDNDGDLDILLTGYVSGHSTGSTILYRNDGGGTFTAVNSSFLQAGYCAAAWGDYDTDGKLDLALSGIPNGSGSGSAELYHNDGNGAFSAVMALAGSYFGSECWGDYDNDGDQDLLQGGRTTLLLYRNDNGALNNSGIAFSPPFSSDSYTYATWADIDNDGDLDIAAAVATSYPNRARILRNDGNGVFTNLEEFPNRLFNAAAWGDYDNDGYLDLVIAGYDNVQGAFTEIYHNDGGTNFTRASVALPGAYYSSVAWGDYNNDGRLDLLLGGQGASNNITRLYRNDGGNVFTLVWTAPQELSDAAVSWGDFNNDGRLDFIICGSDTNGVKVTKLFRNDSVVSNTPPTAPGNLGVQKNGRSAVLGWSPATDAQQSGGLTYNVWLGTAPGTANLIAPAADLATGWRRLPEIGNCGTRLFYVITNLNAGTYYWSVQAIDHAYAGSAFAPQNSFSISAPIITNQPQDQTVAAGQTATFTIGATGTDPLTCQWRFNDADISGATNFSLVVSNAQFVQQGNYSVAVSDVIGTTLSRKAFLTVNSGPIIVAQPQGHTIAPGGGVRFNVGVIGNLPFAYQWRLDGTNIPGATNSAFVLLDAQLANAGNYSVVVTNAYGESSSSNALLSFYQTGQGVQTVSAPGAVDMVYDSGRDLLYITTGSSILRYEVGSKLFLPPFVVGTNLSLWGIDLSFDGNTLVAADHSGGTSIYVVDLLNGTNGQVVLPPSGLGDAGTYSVAFGNDNAALITGDYPGSGWVSLRRYDAVAKTNSSVGSMFNRSLVAASGDGNVIGIIEGAASSGNLYEYSVAAQAITNSVGTGWFCWIAPGVNRDGTQFAYATDGGTFIYDSNLVQVTTLGNYFADRPVGVVYHPWANRVYFVWGGSTEVRVYDTTTLTDLTNYDFGTAFSDATGTTSKTSVRTRISRDGSLLMVNVGDAIKYLRLSGDAPQIVTEPVGTNAFPGSDASFSVAAAGTPPLGYQWLLGDHILAGATNATLTLTNLQPAQFGDYAAVVYSGYGCATSSVAALTEILPPQNLSASLNQGAGVRLQFNGTAGHSYVLQTATNLAPPITWQPIVTNAADTNGDWFFLDTNYAKYPQRYYRASP